MRGSIPTILQGIFYQESYSSSRVRRNISRAVRVSCPLCSSRPPTSRRCPSRWFYYSRVERICGEFLLNRRFSFLRWEGGFRDFSFWSIKTELSDESDSHDLIFRQKPLIRQNRLLDKRLFRLRNPCPLDKLFTLVYLHSHKSKTNMNSNQQK